MTSLQHFGSKKSASDIVFSIDELALLIFSKLSLSDRLRARHVCKNMRRLSFKNINYLILGHVWPNSSIMNLNVHPRYQIPQCDHKLQITENHVRKTLKILQICLVESGKCLQKLHICWKICLPLCSCSVRERLKQYCNEIGQLLIENCSNLKSISFEKESIWSGEVLRKILIHLGPQLEEVNFSFSFRFKVESLFSTYQEFLSIFNHYRLRKLTINVDNIQHFNMIVEKFIFLDHLGVHGPMDFKLLNRLTNLQSMVIKQSIDRNQLKDMIKGLFIQNLHTLHLSPMSDFSDWNFFKKFTSLRSFSTFVINEQYCDFILQNCPFLQHISLTFCMNFSFDHLLGISRFLHLKSLELNLGPTCVTWLELNRFVSMPFIRSFSLRASFKSTNKVLIDQFLHSWISVFPNVQQVAICCRIIDSNIDSVIKGLDKLSKLRHFECYEISDSSNLLRLRTFCKEKQIEFVLIHCVD